MSQNWLLFGVGRIMCELRFGTTDAEEWDIYNILIGRSEIHQGTGASFKF